MRDGHVVQRGTMRDLETAADPFTREFVDVQRGGHVRAAPGLEA
jgi:ABC-type transporter Mla maintaining outer membrane lipid asymmetry ATPase subunit MlaF